MPHKTTGAASSTEVTTGEQSPASLSNPTDTKATEDKQTCVPQPGIDQQDEAKSNCSKTPGTTHIRDLFLSFDKVPIVLSSGHASTAQKPTRFIQDGDRYIFLVEDNRASKVSSVSPGTHARTAKAADEATDDTVQDEEGEDVGKDEVFKKG
ncbi:hypothetical protein OS493_008731 [Desmophyllum pertusum]|uniref:Uncharacterized protein n=1 Tax=Desmophyllum pertusum TaxID=174260 RepID=A0A9W9ZT00_9CNID|nr:hypothetical protein OS493_008731 [Desmophyllum pertusum]